jgi:hypothetical protein
MSLAVLCLRSWPSGSRGSSPPRPPWIVRRSGWTGSLGAPCFDRFGGRELWCRSRFAGSPPAPRGRVERIVVLPGTDVEADTVLIEMSNPELEQSVQDVGLQLRAAEARYEDLKVQLESQLLNQRARGSVQADFRNRRPSARGRQGDPRSGHHRRPRAQALGGTGQRARNSKPDGAAATPDRLPVERSPADGGIVPESTSCALFIIYG